MRVVEGALRMSGNIARILERLGIALEQDPLAQIAAIDAALAAWDAGPARCDPIFALGMFNLRNQIAELVGAPARPLPRRWPTRDGRFFPLSVVGPPDADDPLVWRGDPTL